MYTSSYKGHKNLQATTAEKESDLPGVTDLRHVCGATELTRLVYKLTAVMFKGIMSHDPFKREQMLLDATSTCKITLRSRFDPFQLRFSEKRLSDMEAVAFSSYKE
jgi:hypothetical protein